MWKTETKPPTFWLVIVAVVTLVLVEQVHSANMSIVLGNWCRTTDVRLASIRVSSFYRCCRRQMGIWYDVHWLLVHPHNGCGVALMIEQCLNGFMIFLSAKSAGSPVRFVRYVPHARISFSDSSLKSEMDVKKLSIHHVVVISEAWNDDISYNSMSEFAFSLGLLTDVNLKLEEVSTTKTGRTPNLEAALDCLHR